MMLRTISLPARPSSMCAGTYRPSVHDDTNIVDTP
jgi:hypothetical protein